MAKIEVSNLKFSYNNKDEAIQDLSFSIEEGTWVCIVGHNGSGKSTLAKLLIGLLKADSGTIKIDGIELKKETVHDIRKRVGIVFQNPDNQFVGVTVKHDIAFGLENQCVPQPKMIELINEYAELVGMEAYMDKEPHQLSGGQKQRVAIAGALAMNQDIMIFDEATSMLDPEGVKDITDFIIRLNKEYRKTIITVTHDLEFARLSDQLIVLNKGKVALTGKPDDVFKHKDILEQTELDIPFGMRVYDQVKNDEVLKNKKELVDELWAYSLTK
ncbi:energy-coupling factor transport system ATP-binding protein [Acholeplasma morum]|jgi:energy-coupling factor transport system ATP-binding protein|uniref:energy-coupling factor transporter ATPase n=1 Tax=Paracholeplasma morum TaxID=264637 RepID=UPI0019592DF3|nr:energy-coupling factor transporter ATPase [Paracholeplasma morum]MBM7452912.1 energy-coupling factor transport system ATP-binding protein [Paracholeplasma morum]